MKNKFLNLGLILSVLFASNTANASFWDLWADEDEEAISTKGPNTSNQNASVNTRASNSKSSNKISSKSFWDLWADEDEEANSNNPTSASNGGSSNKSNNSSKNSFWALFTGKGEENTIQHSYSSQNAQYNQAVMPIAPSYATVPQHQYTPRIETAVQYSMPPQENVPSQMRARPDIKTQYTIQPTYAIQPQYEGQSQMLIARSEGLGNGGAKWQMPEPTNKPQIVIQSADWNKVDPSVVFYADQIPHMISENNGLYAIHHDSMDFPNLNVAISQDAQMISPSYSQPANIRINGNIQEKYNAIDYDTYQYEKRLSSQEIYNAINKWDPANVNVFWENYRGNNVRVELLENGRDVREVRLKFIRSPHLHSNADGSLSDMLGNVAEKVMKNVCGKKSRQSIILYDRPSVELSRETVVDAYKVSERGASIREYGFRCIY